MGMAVYFIGSRLASLMWLNLILSACLGGLIYFVLLFLFREFQVRKKEVMKKILIKYLLSELLPDNRKI